METIIIIGGIPHKASLQLARTLSARATQIVTLWQYKDQENLGQYIAVRNPVLLICMTPQNQEEEKILKKLLKDLTEQARPFPRIVLGEFEQSDRAVMSNELTFIPNRPDTEVTFDDVVQWIRDPASSMQKRS